MIMINRDVQRVSNELMYCNIYLKVCLADVCTVMRIQQQDVSDILNGMCVSLLTFNHPT